MNTVLPPTSADVPPHMAWLCGFAGLTGWAYVDANGSIVVCSSLPNEQIEAYGYLLSVARAAGREAGFDSVREVLFHSKDARYALFVRSDGSQLHIRAELTADWRGLVAAGRDS
ncbi:MAG: hypothetical protein AAGE52_03275 [Myxococcota bacterium]